MSDCVYVIFKAGPESYQNEAETCFNFVYPRHIHRRMHGLHYVTDHVSSQQGSQIKVRISSSLTYCQKLDQSIPTL
jgi:hypothetical protein